MTDADAPPISPHQNQSHSLAELGGDISDLFESLKRVYGPEYSLNTGSIDDLSHEADRFELWAVNLGLHHTGHSSLDYRLREVHSLQQTFRTLLVDLETSLTQISQTGSRGNLRYGDGAISLPDQSDSPSNTGFVLSSNEEQEIIDDYGSEDSQERETDYALLLRDVSDIVDRLYKISTRIRTSSTRLRSTRLLHYRQIDPETEVDLIEQFRDIDLCHIRELFRFYKRDEAEATSEDLQRRLAAANTRRRQQFGRWKWHHEKMAQATLRRQKQVADDAGSVGYRPERAKSIVDEGLTQRTKNLNDETSSGKKGMTVPSITTATNLTASHIRAEDTVSNISVSTYYGSEQASDEVQEFPDPPASFRGQKYFECPYCFTLCSGAHAEKSAWRVHLIHDLRPYVCTYKHCETGDHTYDRRRDWAEHEAFTHRKVWRCLIHQDETFPNISLYKAHIRRYHDEDSSTLQTLELMKASQSASSDAHLRPCPFCLATLSSSDKMERHVARHLERVASFALPRSTGLEEDINEPGCVIGSVKAELEDSQSGLSDVGALSDNSSLGIENLPNDDSTFDKEALTIDSLQASELTSEMPTDSIIHTYFDRLENFQRSSSESSDTTTHTPAMEGESLYDQRDHSDDDSQGNAHSNPVPMAQNSKTPFDAVEEKDDAELSLNDDGTSSPGLRFCLVGIAQFINQNFEPKGTSVIDPNKMLRFYELFKVDGERLPWHLIFDDRTSSISRLYRALKVEHHLIQEELDKRPDTPALTPTGFCTLNCILLRILPDIEFSRLQRIMADPIWNSFICTWPQRSKNKLLDASSAHVARGSYHLPTHLRSGQPRRDQFPAKADEDLKKMVFKELAINCGIDTDNTRKSVEGAPKSMITAATVVPKQGGVTVVFPEIINKITENVIKRLQETGSGRQGIPQDPTAPESTESLKTIISTIAAATTLDVDAESSKYLKSPDRPRASKARVPASGGYRPMGDD